jgi:hypothetical protein
VQDPRDVVVGVQEGAAHAGGHAARTCRTQKRARSSSSASGRYSPADSQPGARRRGAARGPPPLRTPVAAPSTTRSTADGVPSSPRTARPLPRQG